MNEIKKGATDVTRYVVLVDSAAGTPETGYTITNLDLQYTRNRTAPAAKVDATALAATDSAHSDNKAIEVDGTSSPGLYRIDWPDAAFATGADKVILVVSGSGLHPAVEEIQLVDNEVVDAYAIVNSGTHGNAALKTLIDTVDDFLDTEIAAILAAVDTEVAAIKAKTDSLTFTVAGQVDANMQYINDTALLGNGAGTPWGPA